MSSSPPDLADIISQEIALSAALIRLDELVRRPAPRFRIMTATGQYRVWFEDQLLYSLVARQDREEADREIEWLTHRVTDFARGMGATHVVYSTARDFADMPRAIVALLIDRVTGRCFCFAQQFVAGEAELGPLVEVALDRLEEAPLLLKLLAREEPLDAAEWGALREADERGALAVFKVPRPADSRVLH